ncbi:MAG: hypothetical protein ACLSVD_03610 [Eggerthellaceae bacterium]
MGSMQGEAGAAVDSIGGWGASAARPGLTGWQGAPCWRRSCAR